MSQSTLLHTLFQYKSWANQELITALRQIDAQAHPKSYRLAVRLLNHTHVVDCIFAAHLTGATHSYEATNTVETPSIDELAAALDEMDGWLIHYVPTLTPEQLSEKIEFTFTDGKAGRMSREEMLAHLVTHGNYHRGAIGRILSEMSITPPRDIFTGWLHRG
ncbi:DinB family protein [Hydromonas duriensis]|uniref:Putative damage-inducible protein DinB n=1 Tax=Hydromonas duriensis TaxID=1527608 RepID=A0A4R6Y4R0_9BURK|nr:DinB family protein [Hydromonas duriensis]TDR30188.1 putative damage-inducible protein DinB [Hydromonas duriensis]